MEAGNKEIWDVKGRDEFSHWKCKKQCGWPHIELQILSDAEVTFFWCKTGSCWASNEILHLLWNLKIFYCAPRALPLVSDLCHMNLLHSFPPLLIEIQVTAALLSVVHFKWPLTCFRLRTLWSIFLSCGPYVILDLMIMKIQQYN